MEVNDRPGKPQALAEHAAHGAPPTQPMEDHVYSRINRYLEEGSDDLRYLNELRRKGWQSHEGHKYFQKQRKMADVPSHSGMRFFYDMMQKIAEEMHQSTGYSLGIQHSRPAQPTILDFCAAPGGFLKMALQINPGHRAKAFSLPGSSGGHVLQLQDAYRVDMEELDITMLAADMGTTHIPTDHPDAINFMPPRFMCFGLLFRIGLSKTTGRNSTNWRHLK